MVTAWDRRAVAKAREYARENGFAPPQAWDDDPGPHFIDDPAATPVPGWEREGREWGVATADTVELAGYGVAPDLIAARLGTTVKTVKRTLERAKAA